MSLSDRLPTVLCQAATGRGRRRLPASGTESLSSVTSSPDGSCRSTGSAATVPARTTTFTVTMLLPPFERTVAGGSDISGCTPRDLQFRGGLVDRLANVADQATFAAAPGITGVDT